MWKGIKKESSNFSHDFGKGMGFALVYAIGGFTIRRVMSVVRFVIDKYLGPEPTLNGESQNKED